MACQRFAGQLKDVAAGSEPTFALRAHVEQCASCREALAAERRLVASIDADVMRAVRVEPSAEFEARVRMRVASESNPAWWLGGWRLAGAVASLAIVVAALVVIVVQWNGAGREVTRTVAEAPAPGGLQTPKPGAPSAHDEATGLATGVASSQVAAGGRAASVHPAGTRRGRRSEPEVLIARDQQAVIARLLQMRSRGKLDEKSLEQPSEAPQPPGPIVVGELSVSPIVVAPAGNEKEP